MPRDSNQRVEEWRQKKPRDPPVKAVGHPRVIHFRKVKTQTRLRDRVAKPGKVPTTKRSDIDILGGDNLRTFCFGDGSDRRRHIPAFSRQSAVERIGLIIP